MKKLQKRFMCLIMLGAVLCFSQPNLVQAQENMVSIMNVQGSKCTTNLQCSGTTAKCALTVTGKRGTSRISGTLKLYDSTAGKQCKAGIFPSQALFTAGQRRLQ
ncbi:MAG: hypothetical protein NC307_02680 [Roseburia sp.]|nr:hypothetical protein [Roseburia sp.]